MEPLTPDYDAPLYSIGIAAAMAGMHQQTLRQYDRLGLVVPARTAGQTRYYSLRDIATRIGCSNSVHTLQPLRDA